MGASKDAKDKTEAFTEVAMAMMQIPLALSRCGIDSETEAMLMEGFQHMLHSNSSEHVKFNFGPKHVDSSAAAREIKRKLSRAVEDWKDWDFHGFGSELGVILRDILLLALPHKYHVDSSGFIRRSLLSPKVSSAGDDSFSPSSRLAFLAVFGALVAAVPVSVWRLRRRAYSQLPEIRAHSQLPEDEDEFLDLEEIFVA